MVFTISQLQLIIILFFIVVCFTTLRSIAFIKLEEIELLHDMTRISKNGAKRVRSITYKIFMMYVYIRSLSGFECYMLFR